MSGLGVMGYGMAINLRKRLDHDWTLCICDLNDAAIDRFMTETVDGGPVNVVKSASEAMQTAV